jgi:hypothetical protein
MDWDYITRHIIFHRNLDDITVYFYSLKRTKRCFEKMLNGMLFLKREGKSEQWEKLLLQETSRRFHRGPYSLYRFPCWLTFREPCKFLWNVVNLYCFDMAWCPVYADFVTMHSLDCRTREMGWVENACIEWLIFLDNVKTLFQMPRICRVE